MKTTKKLLFIAIMLVGISGFSQNLEKLDEKNGFRDMKFGIPFNSFKNLIITGSDGDHKFYTKSGEVLKLGNYDLKSIDYGFYKNKLYSIYIETDGYSNSTGVLSIMENLYGKGNQRIEGIEEYLWDGKNVKLSYRQNSIDYSATITFMSRPIFSQIKEDKKQKDKKEQM